MPFPQKSRHFCKIRIVCPKYMSSPRNIRGNRKSYEISRVTNLLVKSYSQSIKPLINLNACMTSCKSRTDFNGEILKRFSINE